MQYKLLVYMFLFASSLMITIGFYSLHINKQTTISLEEGESNFKTIATAATEVSSYAKRAEGHLLLYLVLHRKADKEKFPLRISSLYEQLSILDTKIRNPEARVIFEKIMKNTDGILSIGNLLIAYHDNTFKNEGDFDIKKHRETVFKLHDSFSTIREYGVNLAALEIRLESELKLRLKENARRLRLYLLFLIALTFGSTMFLGYILINMIRKLKKEIANRIQSETEVIQESNKLRDALTKVKELSGLLPICATCKKVRDDKGYWNQIEIYISEHSDAEFSHGICPDCLKRYYPEYYEELKQ